MTWLDAHASSITAYEVHEIPHAALEVASYGLLLKQDDKGISIASERCGESSYRGYTFVPAGMMVRVEPVIPPPTPRKKRGRTHAAPLMETHA